jgi:hypothetical protein
VFVGIDGGVYERRTSQGMFVEDVVVHAAAMTTGCALDSNLDIWVSFFSNRVEKWGHARPHTRDLQVLTGGANIPEDLFAEDVDLDVSEGLYVGHAAGGDPIGTEVHKYDAGGTLVGEYPIQVEARGSDFIDLASDGCTLFYTSEGRLIKRYDVCADNQLADFGQLPGDGTAFEVLLLPPGDGSRGLLVVDSDDVKRLDGAAKLVQLYDVADADSWFEAALSPTGSSFWAADKDTRRLYRFGVESGEVEVGPMALGGRPGGLCVAGEYRSPCSVLPEPVSGLMCVRRGRDVTLQWSEAADPAALCYYQVRRACEDGLEGP